MATRSRRCSKRFNAVVIDPKLADATRDVYRNHALVWDKNRDKSLFEKAWLDRISEYMPEQSDVLDVGCAAGEPIARYFIERGHCVTGVDTSLPLLEMAQDRFPDHTWKHMDMRELELDRTFDAVIAFNSFFHLKADEQRQTFGRFAAHLKPGGVLWFTSGPSAGEVLGTVAGQQVYHASLAPEEYRDLLETHGFHEPLFVPEDASCNHHSLWLAKRR